MILSARREDINPLSSGTRLIPLLLLQARVAMPLAGDLGGRGRGMHGAQSLDALNPRTQNKRRRTSRFTLHPPLPNELRRELGAQTFLSF